jgi:hypothetical protein
LYALSVLFIVCFLGLSINLCISGILDYIKYQSLGSSFGILFGIIILFSSIPFFYMIAFLNREIIKQLFD